MFVFLSKLLAPLAYPLGQALVLWLAALWLRLRGRRRLAGWACVAGMLVVLAYSSPFVADRLVGSLESRYPPAPVASYPRADAIVVLGGATHPPVPPRIEVEVGGGFDRLLHGMRLLRAGKAERLILTGGTIEYLTGSEVSEAERLARLAEEYGVPRRQLILETASRNTHENGVYTARILQQEGWRRVLLVTSARHMRRSVGVFARQGVEVIPVPTDYRAVQRPFSVIRLLPDVQALDGSTRALKEYVGLFVYWLRDWV